MKGFVDADGVSHAHTEQLAFFKREEFIGRIGASWSNFAPTCPRIKVPIDACGTNCIFCLAH